MKQTGKDSSLTMGGVYMHTRLFILYKFAYIHLKEGERELTCTGKKLLYMYHVHYAYMCTEKRGNFAHEDFTRELNN